MPAISRCVATEYATLRDVTAEVLRRYVASQPPRDSLSDAGPAVLAVAHHATARSDQSTQIARDALATWLSNLTALPGDADPRAALVVGAHVASDVCPALRAVGQRAAQSLAKSLETVVWPTTEIGWEDYDLISGPAGILLALATDPACPDELLQTGANLLGAACSRDDLGDLRVSAYRQDELRAWNTGTVNIGLAHGVPGVVAALTAVADRTGEPDALALPLQRAAEWVAGRVYRDAWGVLTWPPSGSRGGVLPSRPSPRQAWCYGTPGVAWTLHEASRVLGSPHIAGLADEAMSSFCEAFDEDRYLYDTAPGGYESLALCHGAAGTLMICDAFARHVGHEPAEVLRDRLWRYLVSRLDDVVALSDTQMSLLNGATGVLAAMHTLVGAGRAWLIRYGLR